jgi:putative membrane protein
MTTAQLFLSTWSFHPSVLVGCVALLAFYLLLEPHPTRRFAWYVLGVALLAFALVSPLDTLGDLYLFSFHMVQHLILIQLVPPLLLLGLTPEMVDRMLAYPRLRRLERVVGRPTVALPLAVVTLWTWHAPALYDLAVADENVHILQHLCFLVTSTIFWWPVLTPLPERRAPLLLCILYLVAASFSSSILGILITFAPPGLYPAYLHPLGQPEIVHLIRSAWLIGPADDQQIGGLLMWVPGGLAYLFAITIILGCWLAAPDRGGLEDSPAAPVGEYQTTHVEQAGSIWQ